MSSNASNLRSESKSFILRRKIRIMKLNKLITLAATATLGFTLIGCSNGGSYEPVKLNEQHNSVATAEEVVVPETKLIASTYHFDFDNASLSDESKQELEEFAKYLAENVDTTVKVEGYTDAKGKPEYNLALGHKRAEAIASFLEQHGVKKENITIHSYGAERPVEIAQTDDIAIDSDALNRRVELSFEVDSNAFA